VVRGCGSAHGFSKLALCLADSHDREQGGGSHLTPRRGGNPIFVPMNLHLHGPLSEF
jgi:hypothetical protein